MKGQLAILLTAASVAMASAALAVPEMGDEPPSCLGKDRFGDALMRSEHGADPTPPTAQTAPQDQP